jgi:hypothetical protein
MEFVQYYKENSQELILPIGFNAKINKSNLPKGIKGIIILNIHFDSVIVVDKRIQEPCCYVLSSKLYVPHKFNKFLNTHWLTKSEITHLFKERLSTRFGFDKAVDHLPDGLTHIIFGDKFNQSILYLPNSITHLTFGTNFNKSVAKLPNDLTHLTMGKNFNQLFTNLPQGLIYCGLSSKFTCSLDNLPLGLEELEIYLVREISNLPINLKKIKIMNWSNKLKPMIKKIPLDCIILDANDDEISID